MRIDQLRSHTTEHVTANPPPGFSWLSPKLDQLFQQEGVAFDKRLHVTYGTFDVCCVVRSSSQTWFGVMHPQGSVLVFAEVSRFDNSLSILQDHQQLTKLQSSDDHNTRDMPAALFHFLVQDMGINLLSDDVMSHKGDAFWTKMMERSQVAVMVIDVTTGHNYDADQVKAGTRSPKDHMQIQFPHQDRKVDLDAHMRPHHRQNHRFYYSASGRGSHLLEQTISHRTCDMFPNEHRLLMFGEQGYPSYDHS
jgi:hypothetical protein